MVFKVLDKEIKIIKADGGSEIENKLKIWDFKILSLERKHPTGDLKTVKEYC